MTEQELKEIRDRADAATPGEWVGQVSTSHYGEDCDSTDIKSKWSGEYGVAVAEEVDREADWQFIANARADIPKLLDEIELLNEEVKQNGQQFYANLEVKLLDSRREIAQLTTYRKAFELAVTEDDRRKYYIGWAGEELEKTNEPRTEAINDSDSPDEVAADGSGSEGGE